MPSYDFGSGRPDPGSFPVTAMAEAAARAIRQVGGDLVLYPGDLGHRGLREVMAARESRREGVPVSPDQIALTNGSMQAVTLVGEALMERPGDVVVLEELNYPGTLAAYRRLGLRLVGVPIDEQGMRVDALDDTLSGLRRDGTPARFVYTLATYHNPTGAVMPRARRLELLATARRHGVPVVEDNCYGDVHYDGPIPPALFALDDGPDVVCLGSLSKILGAGIRLGYLLARPPMLARLLDRRHDGGNSVLAASICAEYLRDRLWDHVARCNAVLKAKRDAVATGLRQHAADLCTWSHPAGGLFTWVGFPDDVDRDRLAGLAEERGVRYARGAAFHARGSDIPFLRLAFGYPPLEDIPDGMRLLAECIRQARTDHPSGG